MKNGDPHLAAVIHQPDESPEYQIYDNSGQKIRRNASKIIRQKIFQKLLDSALRSDITLDITIRIGNLEEWIVC